MNIKLLFLGFLVAISTSLWAMDAGEFRGETKAKIEILQKQNDQANSKIESLEKDIRDEYKTVTDRQNEQISALQSNFDTFITLLSLIAGIGGVAFPYVMHKQNTKAQETAKNDIEAWKEKTMLEFDKELNSFKDHAQGAKSEITTSVEEAKKVESEIKNIQCGLQNGQSIPQNESNSDSSLSKVATKVREKPQSEYTFEDWNRLAFDAYNQNKLEDTLFYWRNAIKAENLLEIQYVQTLFNIAIVLMNLNRTNDELATYDKLIQRFEQSQSKIILELVTKALFNKGVALTKIGKSNDSIDIYNQIIDNFKGIESEIIQEGRAKAYLNKGFTVGELDHKEEEITVYDKLFQEFQNSQNILIQEQIAISLVNKGINLRERNLKKEATTVFEEMIHAYKSIQNNDIQIQRAKALMSLGGTLGLLNQNQDAIEVYNKLITEYKDYPNNEIQEKRAQAYINRFEMQLIMNQKLEEIQDENIKLHINEDREKKLQFLMLQTIKYTLEIDQFDQIKQLKENFSDVNLNEWSWEELDKWADTIEDIKIKSRVIATIEQFKNWDLDSQSSRE